MGNVLIPVKRRHFVLKPKSKKQKEFFAIGERAAKKERINARNQIRKNPHLYEDHKDPLYESSIF